MDIAEFLTAQLDAEWRLAVAAQGRYADGSPWGPSWTYDRDHFRVVVDGQPRPAAKDTCDVDGEHIAYWDPARVLADIAAKRALLAEIESITMRPADGSPDDEWMKRPAGRMLCALASAYAGRPDFDPAWRIDG